MKLTEIFDPKKLRKITEELGSELISERVKKINEVIYQQREEILKAFIAETGFLPSECEQCFYTDPHTGEYIWWVRKRKDG